MGEDLLVAKSDGSLEIPWYVLLGRLTNLRKRPSEDKEILIYFSDKLLIDGIVNFLEQLSQFNQIYWKLNITHFQY